MNDAARPSNYGVLWSRDELVLAFDLYCRIPFKKTKANNPEVIALAKLLDRSPASVARKLGNFGSFDPELKKRQISGLGHASKLDAEVWHAFNDNWNLLVLEAESLRNRLLDSQSGSHAQENVLLRPEGSSERESTRKTRIHQAFFRDAILSSYEEKCCVTGLPIKEALIASHIVPWSVSEELRTDPHNGLCLSATFDRLFDRGLLTIDGDLRVVVSSTLRSARETRTDEQVCTYHGSRLLRPRRFAPDQKHLDWHRQNVFHE